MNVPWNRIETLFLDIGNTLSSVDFGWVAEELASRGLEVSAEVVRRAEAAARPVISDRLSGGGKIDGVFQLYLGEILEKLPRSAGAPDPSAWIEELSAVLWTPGRADLLWRIPMPGAKQALEHAHSLGLRCVAVSNSDGSAARSLELCGLDALVDPVIDSHVVGIEKPDPRIFDLALEHSGATRETTLHVGDMPFADVEGARRAGLSVVLLDPYDDWVGRDPDCVRCADLRAVVQRIAEAR